MRGPRVLLALPLGLALLAGSARLRAQPAQPPAAPPPAAPPPDSSAPHRADPAMAHDSPLPHYLVRAGMALGSSFGSEHASLLSQDGYDLSSRTMFVTDVSFMPWPQVGLGVFLASAYDGADPGNGAPVLDRTETYYLAQVTGQTVSGVLGLTLSLRAGLADSTLELKDAGKTKSSFAAGVEVAAIVLPAHLGLGFGLLWAPPYTPSDLGRPYQVGGYYFAISGVFHD